MTTLFNALTVKPGIDGAKPLHDQPAIAQLVGDDVWLIDQHHSSKDVRYLMLG